MTKKRIPLFAKILAGMFFGIITGFFLLKSGEGAFVSDWIKPWGTIFIKLLKLIAIPLIFVSLVSGIGSMNDLKKLSKLGLKTILLYLGTTFFAVSLGLVAVNTIKPGSVFTKSESEQYRQKYIQTTTELPATDSAEENQPKPMDFISNLIPENLVAAASDNRNMLQVIFLSLLTGIAVVLVGSEKTAPFLSVIISTETIVLKIIDLVMKFAPIGVFALMAALVVDFSGDSAMFSALGMYALTVVVCLLFLAYIFYPVLLKLTAKTGIKHFLKSVFPVQLVAFSTSSSAATLPFTMEQAQNKLGISEETTSFVMPIGATINMDGTSCYQAIAVLFVAQVFGIELTFAQMITVLFVTIMASIGTAAVPGASLVMTIMVMTTVGIPAEGIAIIIGIDRPLDMLRTVVNVTGDTFVATIIDKKK